MICPGGDGSGEPTYASESAAAIITMVFQHTENQGSQFFTQYTWYLYEIVAFLQITLVHCFLQICNSRLLLIEKNYIGLYRLSHQKWGSTDILWELNGQRNVQTKAF